MRYRFGDLELDDERVRLSRQGRIVEVEPKPLALLVELLRRHPQVVPTEDLLARVWPDAVVTRASVARAVRALRRALGEEAGSDSVIRSVRGRGYGIAVEVARDRPTAFEPLLQAAEAVSPLVGRDAALALLGRSLRAAASGRGQLATIVGEPGIGKSTLAEALREPAEAAGFAVGFGRATDETGAPSLRPFFEILEALHREVGAERFDEAAQADAAVLSRIAPRLFGAAGHDLSVDAVVEERGGRRVVDAIDAFLQRLSEQKPLLVVVDDLQWADATSCRLFGQLARAVGSQSLLLLGCHRSTEPEGSAPGSPFDALLEQLGGLRDVQAPIELVGARRRRDRRDRRERVRRGAGRRGAGSAAGAHGRQPLLRDRAGACRRHRVGRGGGRHERTGSGTHPDRRAVPGRGAFGARPRGAARGGAPG